MCKVEKSRDIKVNRKFYKGMLIGIYIVGIVSGVLITFAVMHA